MARKWVLIPSREQPPRLGACQALHAIHGSVPPVLLGCFAEHTFGRRDRAVSAKPAESETRQTNAFFSRVRSRDDQDLILLDAKSPSVRRLIPLAFLSPRIIEAIAEGRQPVDLTLEALTRLIDLPLLWSAQQQRLGIE
jgi:hypothetical protein